MVLHAQCGTSAYIVSLKPHSIAVSVDGTRVVSHGIAAGASTACTTMG